MKNNVKMLAGLSVMLWAGAACAEIYICKDAAGHTLTSDRPIMECSDRKVRVLGKNGLTAREIAPPMTEEEKHQRQLEDEKKAAAKLAQEEQRRQDRALLARYGKESDIEVARKRTVEQTSEHIKREEVTIATSEKRLKEARLEAESFKKGKGVPANVQRKIDDSETAITESKKQIAERQAEIVQINAKFDQSVKRYRELTVSAQATAKTDFKSNVK